MAEHHEESLPVCPHGRPLDTLDCFDCGVEQERRRIVDGARTTAAEAVSKDGTKLGPPRFRITGDGRLFELRHDVETQMNLHWLDVTDHIAGIVAERDALREAISREAAKYGANDGGLIQRCTVGGMLRRILKEANDA